MSEQTNRQRNNTLAAKDRERKEAKAERQARFLQALRAWNWQWCDEKNRWQTHSTAPQGDPQTCFTSTGPSKRTLRKRHAKGKRTRPAYL